MSQLTDHHRKCRSNGGRTTDRNVIRVRDNLHRSWHTVFGNMLPHEIARYISNVWLDPDFELICVRKRR